MLLLLLRTLCSGLAVLYGGAILLLATAHLKDGLAVDGAIPVPLYMLRQVALPRSIYASAATSLNRAAKTNGNAKISASEAAIYAGAAPAAQIAQLRRGLIYAPLSVRGWLLLAKTYAPTDRSRAASALSQSLVLSPYDYWIAGLRSQTAAILWSSLDGHTRELTLRQIRLLWEEPLLRQNIHLLLRTSGGMQLVNLAFAKDPYELRALNRWVSAESRRAISQ